MKIAFDLIMINLLQECPISDFMALTAWLRLCAYQELNCVRPHLETHFL